VARKGESDWLTKDRRVRRVAWRLTWLAAGDGPARKFVVAGIDITDAAQQSEQAAGARVAAALEAFADAVAMRLTDALTAASGYAELALAGLPPLTNQVIDTLKVAKEMHPGKKNNLNALCDRYQIDNSHRTLHGALLDTELLAEVYLGMTRGQESLLGEESSAEDGVQFSASGEAIRLSVRVLPASDEELALHAAQMDDIEKASKGACVWKKLEEQARS
jgi:PAS domain-containing protein